ncbi:MAG: FtsQ-type POTRA domain-containing protein [Alphaproteobacteria bacterium]|nr:FtsQ-type POTRA domain-containing protein [Alphaproteobacteria bacterium]
MRSVKVQRKSRGNPRTNAARGTARASREKPAASRAFGRRTEFRDDLFARAGRRVKAVFTGPMMLMTSAVVVFALVAALFASGAVGRGFRAVNGAINTVIADAGFGIAEIHITGNARTPYRQVLAVLGMKPGQSIFTADLTGARARLAQLDWIATAEVHRRYPDAIFVTLTEKRPFALWQTPPDAGGQRQIAVVDRDGGVITTQGVEKFRRLPKLLGKGAPAHAAELVDAVQAHRAVAARTAAYVYQSGRRWNLILDDGVLVKLPETGWNKQLDALERLIIEDAILERDVSEIDLRSPTHYFFVLKSGEKKQQARGKET